MPRRSRSKLAYLVLLSADPLADIGNRQRIAAVVAKGRLIDGGARHRLLAEQERLSAGPARPPKPDSLIGGFPRRP